jgi:uncharacterized membrane protein YfcA
MDILFFGLTLPDITLLLLVGVVTGIMAGLFGIGGGAIVVPALIPLFRSFNFPDELVVHMAIGSSLATILFTSISAIYGHHKRHAVLWGIAWKMTPSILVGAWLGAFIASTIDAFWLQRIFALFLLFLSINIALKQQTGQRYPLPNMSGLSFIGGGIGSLSSIVGIGGGTLTVPFLIGAGTPIQRAVATSSACGLPIAIAGSIGYLLNGIEVSNLPTASSGYIYWPAALTIACSSVFFAPVGVRLAHHLPATTIKRLFAIFLFLMSCKLMIT